MNFPRLEGLTCLVAAAAAAPSLVETWRHAPLERWSAAGFALWLAPWARAALRRHGPGEKSRIPALCATASLASLLAGAVLDVHFLRHTALVAACAAFVPRFTLPAAFWLISSLAWMPAAGWLLASGPPGPVQLLRIALCTAGAAALAFATSRRRTPPPPLP